MREVHEISPFVRKKDRKKVNEESDNRCTFVLAHSNHGVKKKNVTVFFRFFFRVLENTNEINALSLWLFCGDRASALRRWGLSPMMRDEN